MRQERSYGVVPLRRHGDTWQVFLVQHGKALYWGYPKGHAEGDETPQSAAMRELKEETSLEVKNFLCDTPFEEHYFFTLNGQKISKTVQLFAAEVTGTVCLQAAEIASGQWVPLKEAHTVLTYEADRQVLKRIQQELEI